MDGLPESGHSPSSTSSWNQLTSNGQNATSGTRLRRRKGVVQGVFCLWLDYHPTNSQARLELTMRLPPFHLAIPVHDLPAARAFYGETFGLEEGRSSAQWVDFNFFGHQLVIHQHPKTPAQECAHTNPVDGQDVPVPHFGVVLPWVQWETLAERLRSLRTAFVIEPCIRFRGQVGEQATMFLLDPCCNALEFKAFRNLDQLFAK